MPKPKKENNLQLQYPHPILRTLNSLEQQSLTYSPSSYQIFHTSKRETVSAKILRPSHIWAHFNRPFSILLHPYHPGVQVQSLDCHSVPKCKKCGAYMTCKNRKVVSLIEIKCCFCNTINHAQPHIISQNEFPGVFDYQQPSFEKCGQNKYLILLQVNEFLYTSKIHTTIIQCLQALKSQQPTYKKQQSFGTNNSAYFAQKHEYKFGIILFDVNRMYILNMNANQVIICDPTTFDNELPIENDQLFCRITDIQIDQLRNMVNEIMYEGFENNKSCLLQTFNIIDIINKNNKVNVCLFLYSMNMGQRKCQIPSNMHTFLILKDQNKKLNNPITNFHKIYDYHYYELEKQVYYDLFHFFTQQIHHNVSIQVRTDKSLNYVEKGNKYNAITSNTPIILNFQWKEGVYPSNNDVIPMQIEVKADGKIRVIDYAIKLANKNAVQAYSLNDQAFFYIQLCKVMKSNNPMKLLDRQAERIIQEISQDNNKQSSNTIPRNLANFFMYCFMLKNYDRKGELKDFLCDNLLREGLQTVCKRIYPKIYGYDPIMKSLKFKGQNMREQEIRVVENGIFLGILIGRRVDYRRMKNIFGTVDEEKFSEIYELPELDNEDSIKMRQVIHKLRECNQLYYLPLKILFYPSEQFHYLYGQYLYHEPQHRRYFVKLLNTQS